MDIADVISVGLYSQYFIESVALSLWTPHVYFESPPTKPNCLRVHQP